ncbi:MAG TPA: 3-hydroxyacyl-CoA dehydrogenase NAD-binding domain-containing protein, partial [Candidatus Polarisedimenticolia bacterium]|nr:3-hydroxyacyl-CoA dehydrogenase NAD-binding domain-containing protein [Candidatus Polarisedimenticolia bacterium]
LQVKRQVVREFEAIIPPSALLATNTSSLSVADIAAASTRPGRVLGLHFFNPVEKMPLLEIVRGPATDDSAVEAALQLARRLGKTPVVVKDTPGFIVNRILMPYLSGAMEMLGREGADPRVVQKADRAMTRFGMPMGPFALLDRIGIDVAAKVAGVLHAAFGGGSGALRAFESMTKSGFTGFKAGRGFYRYRGGLARALSPEVAPLVRSAYLQAADGGPAARRDGGSGGDDDIADRLVDAMVNEAARLLDEGAVDGPEVIDLAMVFGAGFPPFRGGLLRHADAVGPALIASRLTGRGIAPAESLRAKGRFFA